MTTHIESAEQYFPISSFLFVVVVVVVFPSFFFKLFQEKKRNKKNLERFVFNLILYLLYQ